MDPERDAASPPADSVPGATVERRLPASSPAVVRSTPSAFPARSEPLELLPANHPHRSLFAQIFRTRQDAVDACRDHFQMPRVKDLFSASTIIGGRGSPGSNLQEASMRQLVALDVVRTKDGYRLEGARVVETSLEFPGPDGTLRRALIADDSVDRCVERAFLDTRYDFATGLVVERFSVVDVAGEAVYDLR